jgi:hypothetical protein
MELSAQQATLISYDAGGPNWFELVPFALFLAVLLGVWIMLARSRFIQGGVVERPERVAQLYGYTVCLVVLLWALTSVVAIVESTLTLASPLYHAQNQFGMEPSITSFEAFRLTYDRARQFSAPDPSTVKRDSVPEAELRRRYDAYRADRLAITVEKARETLIVRLISLLLAAGLFVVHWRWLQRRVNVAPG